MTSITAVMLLTPEHDFGDAFGGDPSARAFDGGLPFEVYDMLPILAALILIAVVGVIARAMGEAAARQRLRATKRGAAEAVYDEIDVALNRALRAPGGYQLDKARELRDLVHARFAQVMTLTAKPGKTLEGLEKAFKEEEGKLETNSVTPAKMKVAMASEEHRLVVWQGLQTFRAYWDRKAHIIGLIEKAQEELSPSKSGVWRLAELEQRPGGKASAPPAAAVAAAVAGALNDADKAGAAPMPVPTPEAPPVKADSDDQPPPPPAPPPPEPRPRNKGKLPAHKRNMLA